MVVSSITNTIIKMAIIMVGIFIVKVTTKMEYPIPFIIIILDINYHNVNFIYYFIILNSLVFIIR